MVVLVPWFIVMTAMTTADTGVPDFSGRWVLEPGQESVADVARAMSITQALVSGEPVSSPIRQVTVVRDFTTSSQTETYRIGASSITVPGWWLGEPKGPKTRQRVAWQDTTLVIDRGSYTGPAPEAGQWTERRETWSLDPAGRLRLTIITRGSDRPVTTDVQLYRRE